MDEPAAEARGYLLFVGRLRIRKGVEVLLEALARLRAKHPEARLLIAGDGEHRAALERPAARAGSGGGGDASSAAATRRGCGGSSPAPRALVVPSIYEGMPLVVLEAMEAGVPVVASRVSGIPEVVEDGGTGWLVPPEDPEALAAALGRGAGAIRRRPRAAARPAGGGSTNGSGPRTRRPHGWRRSARTGDQDDEGLLRMMGRALLIVGGWPRWASWPPACWAICSPDPTDAGMRLHVLVGLASCLLAALLPLLDHVLPDRHRPRDQGRGAGERPAGRARTSGPRLQEPLLPVADARRRPRRWRPSSSAAASPPARSRSGSTTASSTLTLAAQARALLAGAPGARRQRALMADIDRRLAARRPRGASDPEVGGCRPAIRTPAWPSSWSTGTAPGTPSRPCPRSTPSSAPRPCASLVVDNGSTDGSRGAPAPRAAGLELVETGENLGFAGGNEVGIRKRPRRSRRSAGCCS